MRHSENFQGLFSCQTQESPNPKIIKANPVTVESSETNEISEKLASRLSLSAFFSPMPAKIPPAQSSQKRVGKE